MTNARALNILVLAHDLSDAAVQRRVMMLKKGGATVTLAGFRRSADPIREVDGCAAVDFGRTYNAGFLQRIWSVVRTVALLGRHRDMFVYADIIIARNLEMLAIGVRGRSFVRSPPPLVYECLDIHRLLLRRDFIGMALRWLEGWLSRRAVEMITSSFAFVDGYFRPLSHVQLPVRLVENKMLDMGVPVTNARRSDGPPWIIGWFGILRCRKSLKILADLARQSGGSVQVMLRGRTAVDQFPDFEQQIAAMPGVKFLGAYKSPDDLASMYNGVHFNWTIDMFEEGLNSSWLLPNRLYEGGAFHCVPIAVEAVESGQFLKRLGIGVTLKSSLEKSLADFFGGLTPEKYREMENSVAAVPRETWICSDVDCKAFVHYLNALRGGVYV